VIPTKEFPAKGSGQFHTNGVVRAMKLRLRIHFQMMLVLATLLVSGVDVRSEQSYKVGSTVTAFAASDQFGTQFKLNADCQALLVSFDMGTGKQANVKLSALGKEFLPKHHAIYVANINGMPTIGRVFAIPKMRSYPHRIVLADDAALLRPFPHKEKLVTVLLLKKGKVTAIRFWDPEKMDITGILDAP